MSRLTYKSSLRACAAAVGTACIGILVPGGSCMNSGASTSWLGEMARVDTLPDAATSGSALAPASATRFRPASASTPNGLVSGVPRSGLTDPSYAPRSASSFQRPEHPSTRINVPSPLRASAPPVAVAVAAGSLPKPIGTSNAPSPTADTSCGPVAAKPPSPTSDGSPLTMRRCTPFLICVTAPALPKQTFWFSGF